MALPMQIVDVTSYLDGQLFIWDSNKARINAAEHGVSFELARDAFFDPFLVYEDATAGDELRQGIIGRTSSPPRRLLFVISVERGGYANRIISARGAKPEFAISWLRTPAEARTRRMRGSLHCATR
jgi:uncharacterized DUF497 family protein